MAEQFVDITYDCLSPSKNKLGSILNQSGISKLHIMECPTFRIPLQKKSLPGPKTLFLDRYYFHRRVCVCLCVCLSVFVCTFTSIISKSSWSILMKLGRMIYNDKRQVPFEDELNWPIKTEVRDHLSFLINIICP